MRNKNMFILKYLKLTGDYILNSVVKLWMQILSRMEKFNKCPQSYNVLSQFWLHGVVLEWMWDTNFITKTQERKAIQFSISIFFIDL